jgi:LacI family transcriptional regulator
MIRLAPHIIFRSNLPLFVDRLDGLAEPEES